MALTRRSEDAVHVEVDQRSDAWFRFRAGEVTGSRATAMLAKTKSGAESATRRRLKTQLAVERLRILDDPAWYEQGNVEDFQHGHVTADMQHGIDTEPQAREAYRQLLGLEESSNGVVECGYIRSPYEWVGCSPDGLVGTDGLVELKCYASHTHVALLQAGKIPPTVVPQLRHNLFCLPERSYIDFLAYDDRLRKNVTLWGRRIHRDDPMLDLEGYEQALAVFLEEVERETEFLRALPTCTRQDFMGDTA